MSDTRYPWHVKFPSLKGSHTRICNFWFDYWNSWYRDPDREIILLSKYTERMQLLECLKSAIFVALLRFSGKFILKTLIRSNKYPRWLFGETASGRWREFRKLWNLSASGCTENTTLQLSRSAFAVGQCEDLFKLLNRNRVAKREPVHV